MLRYIVAQITNFLLYLRTVRYGMDNGTIKTTLSLSGKAAELFKQLNKERFLELPEGTLARLLVHKQLAQIFPKHAKELGAQK